jgi:hypothetical protein
MSDKDLYVEIARQKADIAKLQGQVDAIENILYKRNAAKALDTLVHQKKPADKALDFNPEHLTKHMWKGKKLGHRHWADGSLAWGWDFIGEFPEDVIAVLEKGDLTIGESVFSLSDKVVNVKKVGAK